MSSFQEDIHSAVLGFVPFVIECIFYSVYSILFSLCIYVLWRRREMQHRWLHFTFIVALYYSLATVHMVLMATLAFEFDEILLGYSAFIQSLSWDHFFHPPTVLALSLALKVLFLVSNLLVDTILFLSDISLLSGLGHQQPRYYLARIGISLHNSLLEADERSMKAGAEQ
ncbi:hypothetical protein C8J56DRAFT_892915 [Mycena floridula]|nr:hypothetical protein C8J56DRAFT_892915 [Mycena floridula]